MIDWPKTFTYWIENRTLYISAPFTWEIPKIKAWVRQRSILWDQVAIGGPAVELTKHQGPFDAMPWVQVKTGTYYPGVLQLVNPLATKTTTGCIRACPWCAVPKAEGRLIELEDWPDRPILIDNNLLAASQAHFDKVIDRLKVHGWADFNQGLDARLLTDYHAKRIAEIKRPIVRLALDCMAHSESWATAYDSLRRAGIAKRSIRSMALLGFGTDPAEAWARCNWIDSHGVRVTPCWYHPLDATAHNAITPDQAAMGWTDYERRKIMQWFFKHKKAVKYRTKSPWLA